MLFPGVSPAHQAGFSSYTLIYYILWWKSIEARDTHLPALRRAYAVFGDYYTTILLPRGFRILLRKKEGPTPNEQRYINDRTVLYAYVGSVVSPVSEQPYPNDQDSLLGRLSPEIGELDHHIWHPNVALHFATTITPQPKNRGDGTDLSVEIRVWGKVGVDSQALTEQDTVISYSDAGWDHYATSISMRADETRIEQQVTTGLRIVTPNVIHHKEAFRSR